jgi:DNA invertase Pin-like site-specific DNA recombinase
LKGAIAMTKTIAYLRVSTDQQDLNSQKHEIESYAKRRNLKINEWLEVEISSRKNMRDRRITELIQGLKKGDKLIVSELSRLARSMRETHNIVHDIAKRKAELHVIKQNLVTKGTNDLSTKIYINSFAMAAEIERDLISQRTKNGLARVKAEGKKLGNPNLKADNRKRIEKAKAFAENLRGTITSFVKDGYTQRQIVAELDRIGVRTSRGNEFQLTTLQRVMKRLDLATIHTR